LLIEPQGLLLRKNEVSGRDDGDGGWGGGSLVGPGEDPLEGVELPVPSGDDGFGSGASPRLVGSAFCPAFTIAGFAGAPGAS